MAELTQFQKDTKAKLADYIKILQDIHDNRSDELAGISGENSKFNKGVNIILKQT